MSPAGPPETLFFNGVDAASGRYLRSPVGIEGLLRKIGTRRRRRGHFRQLAGQRDAQDLSQAGWGILFAGDVSAEVRNALAPLRDLRRSQAGELYQEIEHEPGEDVLTFLARFGRRFGPVDPAKIPYYLLIVASPEAIPYEFQYQLDVQLAVGRLWLRGSGEYEAYVKAVLEAEGRTAPSGRAVFFAPRHEGDPLSALSADGLAAPLARKLGGEALLGDEATKADLRSLLENPPGLLLTAGHGIGLHAGDRRQEEVQGALLCQGWREGTISGDIYLAARDIPRSGLDGMVAFLFACYSAGTPRWDSFSHLETGRLQPAAERPFVARLPQRLLAAGTLAVVGHIDQAWPCSFVWEDTGAQLEAFETTLGAILRGERVGAALEAFGQRYAEIATALSSRMEPVVEDAATDLSLLRLWIAHNDARSFALLGDPAVRLVPAAPSPGPAGPPGSSAPPWPSRRDGSSA